MHRACSVSARMCAKGIRTSNRSFMGVLAVRRPRVYAFVMRFVALRTQAVPMVQ